MKVMKQDYMNEIEDLQSWLTYQRDKFKWSATQVEEKVKLVLAKKKSILAENEALKQMLHKYHNDD